MQVFPFSLLLSLFIFSFSTSMTPGPNNIMLMSSGLTFGYRKTLPHILGVVLGFPLMTVFVGLGLGELFQNIPHLFNILKVGGTFYLLWLAWHIAKSKPKLKESDPNSKPLGFYKIVFFQWVNVKNWIKIITATSVYVTSSSDYSMQVIIISLIFFSTVVISANSWAIAGSVLQKLVKSDKGITRFNTTMAVLLVASIVPTFIK